MQPNSTCELEVSLVENFSTIYYSASNISTNKINLYNLSPNTQYYWHVRYLSPLPSLWSAHYSFIQFNPATVNNLSLWLKSDSAVTISNGSVLTWKDLSSNQYSLTQATVSRQPTLIQNFCNDEFAIKFDGNDFFEIPNYTFGANNTVFALVKSNAISPQSRYIGSYSNNLEICSEIVGFSGNAIATYTTNEPTLLTSVRFSGNNKVLKNDSIIGTSSINLAPLTAGSLYIGRSTNNNNNEFITGEIAEILIFSSQLNDSIISLTNRYLMDKYSQILTLGQDTTIVDNFCSIILDAGPGFTQYQWSTGDTSSNISVNTSGTYSLMAKDFFGRQKYDTIVVQFPGFNQLTSQFLCAGNSLIWSTGLSSSYTHQWQDNSTQNNITINNNGSYYFTVTDTYGCSFTSDTIIINIDNFAFENSLGNDTSLCAGNSIQLQNFANTASNYIWSTGSFNDTIVPFNTGIYWVEVSNTNNCIFRDTINIVMAGVAPVAAFSALNGCEGAPIIFTDNSLPPFGETIAQWLWNFGDGESSNLQNNVHTFDSAGVYDVSLKVILQSGCGAIFNQSITVFEAPQLSYTAFNLCNEKLTEFNNTSNLFGGNLQSVTWDFGNPLGAGNIANTNQAFHSYNLPGTYNISLIIETVEGCIDSLDGVVNIKPSPIANFTTINNCLTDSTLFTDVSQIDFPWQSLSRIWQFPNGDTSLLYQPKFSFDTASAYNVTLFVQSTNGCSDTISKTITIFNKPEANFTYENNCKGAITQFEDSSSCTNCQIVNYDWTINNNYQGNDEIINYVFNDTGSYSINLSVRNNAGCSSSKDTILKIKPNPVSNFTLNSYFSSPPFTPEFNNLSQFATNYSWDFGDGNFSQAFNPEYIFNDTGVFFINLKALNNENCESTYTQTLKLFPKKIDLAIYSVSTNLIEEYIETDIVVFNKSTTLVTNFDFIISNNSNFKAKESYSNPLIPGEFKNIKLNTKILQGEGFNLSDVLCIELTNIEEGLDYDLSNNSVCKVITSNDFKLIKLFPNPAIDELSISFICPSIEEVFIALTDLSGNIIANDVLKSKIGYNKSEISTSLLSSGAYICKVNYKGFVQSLLFVKSK